MSKGLGACSLHLQLPALSVCLTKSRFSSNLRLAWCLIQVNQSSSHESLETPITTQAKPLKLFSPTLKFVDSRKCILELKTFPSTSLPETSPLPCPRRLFHFLLLVHSPHPPGGRDSGPTAPEPPREAGPRLPRGRWATSSEEQGSLSACFPKVIVIKTFGGNNFVCCYRCNLSRPTGQGPRYFPREPPGWLVEALVCCSC